METGKGPRAWLKEKQTVTVEDLSNDIWIRIERVNRSLEKYGRGDFIRNMPVLFAMYYYAVVTIMQIPEEPTGADLQRIYRANVQNLDDECLIEEGEAAQMVEDFHEACRKMAEAYVRAKNEGEQEFNPFAVIVTEVSKLLGLDYQDIHVELANHLADFAMSYRVGDAAKKYPLKS